MSAGDFEKYLKGEPLNEHLAALQEEAYVPDLDAEPEPAPDLSDLTDDDREHLRLLVTEPGWQVLLKLLDKEIASLEDAARRYSLESPFDDSLKKVWAQASFMKMSRVRIVALAKEHSGKRNKKAQ